MTDKEETWSEMTLRKQNAYLLNQLQIAFDRIDGLTTRVQELEKAQ